MIFLVSVPLGAGGGGRRPVIVTGPFSFWESSKVMSFGAVGGLKQPGVKLRRFVVDFSGMIYVAELLLWEE